MDEVKLDQLPYLVMKKIFGSLDLRDLVRARAVCRQLKFYADQVEVHTLVVSEQGKERFGYWHLTERSIDFEDSITWSEFRKIKQSQFNLKQQLKFLCIHLGKPFDFRALNSFKQLVHLEISFGVGDNRTKTLKLPKLKVLKFAYQRYSCVLKTPKLEILSCSYVSDFKIESPETIRWLESNYAGSKLMGKFRNLEFFKTRNTFDLDPDLLTAWKNLKELDITFGRFLRWRFGQAQSSLVNILRQRKILKRDELQCYLNNVQLIDESQLDDYWHINGRSYFKLKHYKLLRGSQFDVRKINYNSLEKVVPELSDDFFDKFSFIYMVEATATVANQQPFQEFLKNLKRLTRLNLTNTSLSQSFMESLPKICGNLKNLTINEISTSILADFNFILQFSSLCEFKTNQKLKGSFDLAAKAFLRLPISRFQFREGDELVLIHRRPSIEATYDLEVYELKKNNEIGLQRCGKKNLKWATLIDLWKQRKEPAVRDEATRSRKRFKADP